jgi:hypothetical protein
VRLQTLGVAEHRYNIVLGGIHYNWLMYDVGGAVSLPVFLHCVPSPVPGHFYIRREGWCVLFVRHFARYKSVTLLF